ncbi:hypothetical protein L6R50_08300 [Myxococcota bacterium]|nr:hypothetical protein [Myxococcota bacterium]
MDLPEEAGFSTIAGLCLDLAGRVPAPGERLEAPEGTVIEVTEATPRHVRAVRVYPRRA